VRDGHSFPEPVEGQTGSHLGSADEPDRAGSGRSGKKRSGRRRPTEEPDQRHDGPEADPETLARTIVLRKLSAQARTRQELAKALADRDVPEEAADAVLDRMEEVGLVDDRTFAHDWVESRQSRRKLSRSAIRRELITKGVDRDDIDEALAEVGDEDELNAARALAEKKARSMTNLEPQVRYRRLAGALARRGFAGHVTSQVLDEVLSGRNGSDQP
jgi:regulatory protein